MSRIFNVLFICNANSARSILAEAVLRHQGAGRFQAFSAGSQPAGAVHPLALELLERNRLNTDQLRSKSWLEFSQPGAPAMDFVLTVCDKAAGEVCPVWPGQPLTAHWGVPDPVNPQLEPETQRRAFSSAYLLLHRRISIFQSMPVDKLDRLALANELARIGQVADTDTRP